MLSVANMFSRALFLLVSVSVLVSCGMGLYAGGGSVPGVTGATTKANSDGTVTVTITGTGFVAGDTVMVNITACTNVTVLSSTQLTCVLPNGNIPITGIVVTAPGGGSSGSTNSYHVVFESLNNSINSNFSSLATADSQCATDASFGTVTKSLGGTWRAILSDSTHNARDRITFINGASIKNTHGDTIAVQGSDLWSKALLKTVDYDRNGALIVPDRATVWTGTNTDGTRYTAGGSATQNNCSDWSNNGSDNAAVGDASSISGWLNNGAGPTSCGDNQTGLLCINSN